MPEVIPFDKRERNHIQGPSICIDCKHEWQAVISEKHYQEVDGWLECPSCSTHKGRLKHPFYFGTEHWQCSCGNSLFQISKKWIWCPNCGQEQNLG